MKNDEKVRVIVNSLKQIIKYSLKCKVIIKLLIQHDLIIRIVLKSINNFIKDFSSSAELRPQLDISSLLDYELT